MCKPHPKPDCEKTKQYAPPAQTPSGLAYHNIKEIVQMGLQVNPGIGYNNRTSLR